MEYLILIFFETLSKHITLHNSQCWEDNCERSEKDLEGTDVVLSPGYNPAFSFSDWGKPWKSLGHNKKSQTESRNRYLQSSHLLSLHGTLNYFTCTLFNDHYNKTVGDLKQTW